MIRLKSLTHQILEALSRRMELDSKTQRYLINLDDGHEGELDLDHLMDVNLAGGMVLKDVKLRTPLGDCQIDTLVVKGDWLFVYECKNYPGDYVYRADSILRLPENEFDNPEAQLNKQCNRLKALLKKENLHFRIVRKVVYINPTTIFYDAPERNHFLLRGQIEKHLKQVNALADYPSNQHARLLQVLKEHERSDIRFDDIPEYTYAGLNKGLYCMRCGSQSLELERNVGHCRKCQMSDKIARMLGRNIYEFTILFPDKKLKPRIINEWCGGEFERHRIGRAIRKHNEMEQTSKKK